MRVSTTTRDVLAAIAESELGGVGLDEALRIVLFEHRSRAAVARLAADEAAAHAAEVAVLAEVDTMVSE